ncbi:hypothetical protein UJ101_00225 [Flavobacteriaceae bacterium UJ101]|nr:hypothetical protein UJ101_00225 [Flavobacteriaceae bacterium UJ101]
MKTNIVICGAGIIGVATAYYLSKKYRKGSIVLIDKQQPLSFTTSKSGENFRDYWPQQCMTDFSTRSINLMEELRAEFGEEAFKMEYSGYDFISKNKGNPIFSSRTVEKENSTALNEITNEDEIKEKNKALSDDVKKVIEIKKAGNVDVQALGNLLLKQAKKNGVQFVEGEIVAIEKNENYSIKIKERETTIQSDKLVIAVGPFLNEIAQMVDLEFPIENIVQRKFIIPDPEKIIDSKMPFTIYADEQYLDWTEEEKIFLEEEQSDYWLLNKFPGGLHVKPDSGGIKMGWAFNRQKEINPKWEIERMDLFPNVVLKGASRFIPELKKYEDDIPTPLIQYAGYYTRTKENWPIIGPSKDRNIFIVGAFSGFGTMTACAAGELCADYIVGKQVLPSYAAYFHPNRYDNASIMKEIIASENDGQL